MSHQEETHLPKTVSRRRLLQGAAGAAAAATGLVRVAQAQPAGTSKAATKGRIKHSIVFWCFNVGGDKWDIEKQCQVANTLGCKSVELVGPEDFAVLKKHGLVCAITPNGMPGEPYVKGLNNLKHHDEIVWRTKKTMDAVADAGFPNVIAFNGYKWRDAQDPTRGEIPMDEGADNCVAGLKKLAAYAEIKGVTVCVEILNSRDDTHPMKGHPGYQGDHTDYVADIIKRVGSPRVKILFDIYHIQVMDGDIIRRIRQYHELIGHVHTAGCPGRNELDESQELNYTPCMQALVDVGYTGYVGHEFIPTRDPMQGLTQAIRVCDV